MQLCDNSNLFYRGAAQQEILKEDGLHLSKDGTKLLAKNIRESLYNVFDFPIITYDSRENGASHSPTKIDTGNDGIKYGRGKTSSRARKAITNGGMTEDGSTITWEIGDMMIPISGTRGMMTSTISADTISRRRVLGIETVTIRGIIDDHMLHTTSRDVINLLNFP